MNKNEQEWALPSPNVVVILLILLIFALSGCAAAKEVNTTYQKNTAMTGLFLTADEAEARAKVLVVGRTLCPDGLKDAGFDPYAPNVNWLPGAKGLRNLIGTDNPTVNLTNPADVEKFTAEFNRYNVFIYPIRDIKDDKDGIYVNKQDQMKTGRDGEYAIICKDKMVFGHGFSGQRIVNQSGVFKKIGGSVVEFLMGVVNPFSYFLK